MGWIYSNAIGPLRISELPEGRKNWEIRTENAEVVGHLELFGELASMFYLCEVRSIHCPPPFDPFKDWMSYKGAWDCRVALRVAVKLW